MTFKETSIVESNSTSSCALSATGISATLNLTLFLNPAFRGHASFYSTNVCSCLGLGMVSKHKGPLFVFCNRAGAAHQTRHI
jgi:hypothetical protein